MKKFKQKSFWLKGGGEIIGFAYILPFIIMLLCCIIAAAQISIVSQRLSYTAYNSCRSAVVSVDENTARERGLAVFENVMGDSAALVSQSSVPYEPFELTVLDGAPWQKGSFVRCTVRVYVNTLLPFTSGVREETIVMMIENTAPSDFQPVDGAD